MPQHSYSFVRFSTEEQAFPFLWLDATFNFLAVSKEYRVPLGFHIFLLINVNDDKNFLTVSIRSMKRYKGFIVTPRSFLNFLSN